MKANTDVLKVNNTELVREVEYQYNVKDGVIISKGIWDIRNIPILLGIDKISKEVDVYSSATGKCKAFIDEFTINSKMDSVVTYRIVLKII